MNLWEATVLGLVEGITEYLPVSSTGHLILASALLGLDRPPETKAAVDAFAIVIQGGAVLAVLGLYWPRVLAMLDGLRGRNPAGRRLLGLLVVAFLPAGVLGPLLDDAIEARLFNPPAVIAALAFWGAVMVGMGAWQRRRFGKEGSGPDPEALSWRAAAFIGVMQCMAMWPGTSRSMITIVAAMLVGLRPRQAAEFSFLLALPTLGGACVYKAAKDALGSDPSMLAQLGPGAVAVGILVATASAALAVRWLVSYLDRHGLAVFGWYRLALSAVYVVLVASGWLAFAPQAPTP
ncbi:MAG TPA: undecaprenyl-diphosphate phosphatase [Longimicrobiales bacterium]|nr:undecaprenyl-diphosphate phosphatase [Longimicrobiales bacterium]